MMKRAIHWSHQLIPRFIATYILVLVLPSALLCYSVYNGAVSSTRAELTRVRREAAYSNRLYLQNQLNNIEAKYDQFKNRSSLRDILDSTYFTDKNVMYEYVREVSSLISSNQSDTEHVRSITIYTSNPTASRILPAFRPLTELYALPLTEAFASSPQRELFRRFWVARTEEGELRLTYYAGLMNALNQRVNGVLAIECGESLFRFFLQEDASNITTYLFSNGELVYSHCATPQSERIANARLKQGLTMTHDTDIELDEQHGMMVNTISLSEQDMIVIQIYPLPNLVVLPANFWMAILLFGILSALLFIAVFHPIRKITKLARHMRLTQTATLLPYPGMAGDDEVGDLIREYNAMVVRTNELSHTVHQNELLLRNAQIEMLQSQLNPHFFYGTLENIRMIAEMHGETLIAEIAYEFGSLMRYSLSREFFVPLQKEIDIVRQYLEIQKKRLCDRFTVEWHIDADAELWNCPKFILFSMVENVFTHDVTHTRRVVHIVITLSEQADDLHISVCNDGPGVEPERLASIQRLIQHPEERKGFASSNNGRSIFNISDRLQLYYGDHCSFSMESEPDKLTVCSVHIYRTARAIETEEGEC